jgi:uncharacterized protein YqgC (DUF456 family)
MTFKRLVRSARKQLSVMVPIVPAVAGILVGAVVALSDSPRHASHTFYEIAAQVTVVLILAAALQAGLFRLSRAAASGEKDERAVVTGSRFARFLVLVYALYLAGTLIYAEVYSLVVVVRNSSAHAAPGGILFALVAGTTAVAVAGMIPG